MNRLLIPKVSTVIEQVLIDAASTDFNDRFGRHNTKEYKVGWCHNNLLMYYHIIKAILFFITKGRNISRLVQYSIDGINVGVYAYSTAVRSYKVYDSNIFLYYRIFRMLMGAVRMFFYATKIINESSEYDSTAVYIKDLSYLNGIMFDVLMKGGVPVYSNKYPHGYMYYDDVNLNTIMVAKYNYPKIKVPDNDYHDYMKKRMENPNDLIPYFRVENTASVDILKDINEEILTVLVYAHSFTDSQLAYGYDGLSNMHEWLVFTIDMLSNQKVNILVKGHPNFWSDDYETEIMKWDNKLWNRLKNQYSDNKSIVFIDKPVSNYDLLSKLNVNNTITVSHHGNAAVEASYLGFKSISSKCSPWGGEYYSFCEMWETRTQYINLLENIENIKCCDKLKLKNFVVDRYMYKYCYHGESIWFAVLAKEIGVKLKEIAITPSIVTMDKFENYIDSISKISSTIGDFTSIKK